MREVVVDGLEEEDGGDGAVGGEGDEGEEDEAEPPAREEGGVSGSEDFTRRTYSSWMSLCSLTPSILSTNCSPRLSQHPFTPSLSQI